VRAQFVLSEIGIGLRRNLTMTIAVVVTVAISLALFGSGLLIRKQVETMKDFWYDKVEVSVYLCGEVSDRRPAAGQAVTDAQRAELEADLRAMPEVDEVFYESQQDAYEHFQEQFADSPDLVENVTADVLPESFRVKLDDPTQFSVVARPSSTGPGVEEVQDQKALLEGFFSVLNKLQLLALIIAGVQVLAAVLLISNTIRVARTAAARDRHHAPRRREQPLHPAAVPARGRARRARRRGLRERRAAGAQGVPHRPPAAADVRVHRLRRVGRRARDPADPVPDRRPLAGLSSFVTLRRHLRV
jgi:cell division protein FtsX